jgi:predicted hydrolase (HD superfamily)
MPPRVTARASPAATFTTTHAIAASRSMRAIIREFGEDFIWWDF